MMPNRKMALHAVNILTSTAKVVPQSCAVKEELGRFHKVSWHNGQFGPFDPLWNQISSANGQVRPKSRNELVLKLGTLEISSDVWIFARGSGPKRESDTRCGLSDMIRDDLQNISHCALENPAAPRPRLRPMKGARGPWRYTLGPPRLLKLEEVCTVQCAGYLAESTGQVPTSGSKRRIPSADPSRRERPQIRRPPRFKTSLKTNR